MIIGYEGRMYGFRSGGGLICGFIGTGFLICVSEVTTNYWLCFSVSVEVCISTYGTIFTVILFEIGLFSVPSFYISLTS